MAHNAWTDQLEQLVQQAEQPGPPPPVDEPPCKTCDHFHAAVVKQGFHRVKRVQLCHAPRQ